jgi:hypothetical protein
MVINYKSRRIGGGIGQGLFSNGELRRTIKKLSREFVSGII